MRVSICKLQDCSGHKSCKDCHAAYMREWRKTHKPTPEQRRRGNARSYAKVYVKRGKIEKKPCRYCGDPRSEMHHPDYRFPLCVEWTCRAHHLELHKNGSVQVSLL